MGQIIDILTSIGDFFSNVVGFIGTLLSDLIDVIALCASSIVKVTKYITFIFPPALVAVLLAGIAVAIIYKILGREG